MSKALKFILILILGVSLTGCIEYEDVSFMGVQDYSFKKVDSKHYDITFDVKVKNPNKYNIKVKRSTFDVFLNGKDMGDARMQKDIVLQKKSTDVHQVVFRTTLKDMGGGLMNSLSLLFGGTAKVRIKGRAKAKAYGIGKKFDVDFEQDVKLSDLKPF